MDWAAHNGRTAHAEVDWCAGPKTQHGLGHASGMSWAAHTTLDWAAHAGWAGLGRACWMDGPHKLERASGLAANAGSAGPRTLVALGSVTGLGSAEHTRWTGPRTLIWAGPRILDGLGRTC
ncbi:hypothetical protein SDJN03_24059, partial [Cucurbita argyrosperma subsp. sororia]